MALIIIYRTILIVWIAAWSSTGDGEPATPAAIDSTRVRGHLAERIDRFLSGEVDGGFNGAVLVARDGAVLLHRGYGWADRDRSRPVTTATPFWIASISKQFAAAAVLVLEAQGRLSVRDSIARFFPEAPADKRGITIHQLLTHTSGLAQHYAADGVVDRDAAVRAVLEPPLARPPGEGFGYTNDAYNLVAAIVEVASGLPYERFVRDRLLAPAGMAHTGFWGPAGHPEVAAIVGGKDPDSTVARPNWGFRGATGMYSTTGDLYRWHLALEAGRVLGREDARRLATPHVKRRSTGVGYGWFVSQTPGGATSIWTRGYEDFGHGAVLIHFPRERVVVSIVSNSGAEEGGEPVSHRLSKAITEWVLAPEP